MSDCRSVLIISENAPVPADRRVWNESRTLTAAGWSVTIVCPQGRGRHDAPFEVLEGIEIHRFPLRPASGGAISYLREYVQAFWRMRSMIRRLGRKRHFDIVHSCNPPDFLLLAARSLRGAGTRFVFDHHDLVPELYRSRFGGGTGALHRIFLAVEQVAYRAADVVIATNDSYRRVAIDRGRIAPEDVFVVRNGPDLQRFRPMEPDQSLRRGKEHLVAYLGIMGPQDGVDHAVRALGWLAGRRADWHAIFIGDGDVLAEMRSLAADLGIANHVEFAGWRGDEDIRRILSTADVCLAPDPPSPLNDVSTMIKIAEYMAMGRPVVSYPLAESLVSAGAAAVFADGGDPESMGRCVDALLDDPERRRRLGAAGRRRVEDALCWERSEVALLAAYERALAQVHQARGARRVGPRIPRPAGLRQEAAEHAQ
jgi:glycosyltransferase involved in cell wall biosynthesis